MAEHTVERRATVAPVEEAHRGQSPLTSAMVIQGGIDFESCEISGRLIEEPTFVFKLSNGTAYRLTADEMRADPWWESLPERWVLTIEARLYPWPEEERAVHFVARSHRGRLVPNSLLSPFFEGPDAEQQARLFLLGLKADPLDASVFQVASAERGRALLAWEGPGYFGEAEHLQRARAARAERAAARQGARATPC